MVDEHIIGALRRSGARDCGRRKAARTLLAAVVCGTILTACGPDPTTEALRQENAALRRDAENRDAVYGTNTPLTDSARAAAGLSSGPGPAAAPKTGDAAIPMVLTDTDAEHRLDLPVYPNAKLSRSPGAPDNSVLTGGGVNIELMETPDKLEPVVAFYMDKMAYSNADPMVPGSKNPPARSDRIQDKMRVVTLSDMQPGGGMRSVTVHEDVGRTYIELMHITGKQQVPASVLPPGSSNTAGSSNGTGTGSQKTASAPPAPATGSTTAPSTSGPQPDNDPLRPTLLLPGGKH